MPLFCTFYVVHAAHFMVHIAYTMPLCYTFYAMHAAHFMGQASLIFCLCATHFMQYMLHILWCVLLILCLCATHFMSYMTHTLWTRRRLYSAFVLHILCRTCCTFYGAGVAYILPLCYTFYAIQPAHFMVHITYIMPL